MSRINVLKVLAIITLGSMMYGQAPLTWVSGLGDDVNPCSRTAPCKTFAGASSKTAPGGEIDALDPGNFGSLTITQSITIDGGGGQVASIRTAGTHGIKIAAQPNDVVIIRNLRLGGFNNPNQGIVFQSGKHLSIENVYISGFSNCILIVPSNSASVHILNSVVEHCDIGIFATTLNGDLVTVGIDNSAASFLTAFGIITSGNTRVVVNRSLIEHASLAGISTGEGQGGGAQSTIDHCDISHNGTALATSGSTSVSLIADSKVAFNEVAFSAAAGGKNFTFGTNRVHSNVFLGTAPLRIKEQ
jgi:hypothetical protein